MLCNILQVQLLWMHAKIGSLKFPAIRYIPVLIPIHDMYYVCKFNTDLMVDWIY